MSEAPNSPAVHEDDWRGTLLNLRNWAACAGVTLLVLLAWTSLFGGGRGLLIVLGVCIVLTYIAMRHFSRKRHARRSAS